jgi:hypothetical protein
MTEEKNMGDLERSFRYPLTGEGWGPKFAFGGILYVLGSLLGFLPWVGWIFGLLIAFLPLGYAYKVFRNHLGEAEGPLPGWEDWGKLFTLGLFVFLLSLGYWIIPGLIYWLGKALWDSGGFYAFLGVLFMALIQNAMIILGLNPFYQQIVVGIVLLIAVGLDQFARARRRA